MTPPQHAGDTRDDIALYMLAELRDMPEDSPELDELNRVIYSIEDGRFLTRNQEQGTPTAQP